MSNISNSLALTNTLPYLRDKANLYGLGTELKWRRVQMNETAQAIVDEIKLGRRRLGETTESKLLPPIGQRYLLGTTNHFRDYLKIMEGPIIETYEPTIKMVENVSKFIFSTKRIRNSYLYTGTFSAENPNRAQKFQQMGLYFEFETLSLPFVNIVFRERDHFMILDFEDFNEITKKVKAIWETLSTQAQNRWKNFSHEMLLDAGIYIANKLLRQNALPSSKYDMEKLVRNARTEEEAKNLFICAHIKTNEYKNLFMHRNNLNEDQLSIKDIQGCSLF